MQLLWMKHYPKPIKDNQNKRKRSNLGYISDHFLIQEFEFNYMDEEVV